MRTDLKRRVAALERGDPQQSERYAIIERETAARCAELGIPEPADTERAAFRTEYEASKPAIWHELSGLEQTAHFVRFVLGEPCKSTREQA